ncbi:hypothetical protein HOK51_07825 [Candidatus Woesearchaeota archaeon]|jgi:hypothetical protein|nr:hypothetical protein [Candidatus Woesearchaeota archaeon]MBT6519733.1 hypothetical protein [Candidatus Woesearchaeota archaeon]MBT7368113.1 hypothetical protein [Candidatus Woesearchaeota archaeon]
MTQTNLALKKLQGIKPKGIKSRSKTILETLLELCDQKVEEYVPIVENTKNYYGRFVRSEAYDSLYPDFYSKISSELDCFSFNELDLKQFIISKGDFDNGDHENLVMGWFSAVLLELLTEKNSSKNKHTQIHLNGEGSNFDYLFYGARKFGDLFLENFSGRGICSCIGKKGVGNSIIGKNIYSDYFLSNSFNQGFVNSVIVLGCSGEGLLSRAFTDHSRVNLFIGCDLEGKNLLEHCVYNNSRVGLCYLDNIDSGSEDFLYSVADCQGNIGFLYLNSINCAKLASGNSVRTIWGKVPIIIGKNISCESSFSKAGDYTFGSEFFGLENYSSLDGRNDRGNRFRSFLSSASYWPEKYIVDGEEKNVQDLDKISFFSSKNNRTNIGPSPREYITYFAERTCYKTPEGKFRSCFNNKRKFVSEKKAKKDFNGYLDRYKPELFIEYARSLDLSNPSSLQNTLDILNMLHLVCSQGDMKK